MQERAFFFYISTLYKDFTAYCTEELRKHNMTVGLMYFILYVSRHPGCTPAQLTAALELDRGYAVRSINKLVEDGFLTRSPHPLDGRASVLYATPKGEEIFALSHRLLRDWDARTLADLNADETEQLFAMLDRIHQPKNQKGSTNHA